MRVALSIGLSLFLLSLFNTSTFAQTDNITKKYIPISMGINLNEPQSQIDSVTHAQQMGDLAKSFRPFDESILRRVQASLETKGVSAVKFKSEDPALKNVFVDEYMDLDHEAHYTIARDPLDDELEQASFSLQSNQALTDFKIRGLVNRFAQTRYNKFSEFGITVNKDRTVLLKKGSFVYTTGLTSTVPGDVPDGIYPLYFKGDVEVSVEGFAEVVDCPEKYETANQCLDIKIPEEPSEDGVKLTFTANSDTHLKDFHLILPTVDHQAILDGEIVFNPDYLEYIKPFSTYRVMNMMLASPRAPFECVTTFVKGRDVYSIPQEKLEAEYLTHIVNIKLLDIVKNTQLEFINLDSLEIVALIKTFKELKNEDGEIVYTEQEVEMIESMIDQFLAKDDFMNIMTLDYRVKQSEKALKPIKDKLLVLREKGLEFNWNTVNPDEDYGNCLMKYSRTPKNRARLGDQFWGSSYLTPEERWRGLPYEVIVELVNQTKSNVWLNIPHNASIDYVTEIASYFNEHLNKESKVFLELSNEVWNGGFASQKYFVGLSKYRYEHYVFEFLEQFEDYLKTSTDRVVSYQNLRQDYLVYFDRYKKDIFKELADLRSCKSAAEFNELVDSLTFSKQGAVFAKISQFITDGEAEFIAIPRDLEALQLSKAGATLPKISQFILQGNRDSTCDTELENDYVGNDRFIKGIQYKKGNFFENLSKKIPYLNAYWLGYGGAVKGDVTIQELDDEGNSKDVLVNRYEYVKQNKSELHTPDLVYHFSGDEVRDLQVDLFKEFKRGWENRVNNMGVFDKKTNADIFVIKNLDRAYKTMAQMAYVHRLDHVAEIWIESGFNEKNLIVTLGTKQNNPNLTQSMLDYAVKTDALKNIDAVTIPAYFYGCFGDLKIEDRIIKAQKFGSCKGVSKGVLNAKTPEEIIDILKDPANPNGVEAIRKEMIAHKAVMDKHDKRLQLVAYEGGHHLALANLGWSQRKYIANHPELKAEKLALFEKTIEHEGMGGLTKSLYKMWLEEGGKVFNNFYMPQTFHEWGSFGLSLSLSDRKTSRYLAAAEFALIFQKAESARKAAKVTP